MLLKKSVTLCIKCAVFFIILFSATINHMRLGFIRKKEDIFTETDFFKKYLKKGNIHHINLIIIPQTNN